MVLFLEGPEEDGMFDQVVLGTALKLLQGVGHPDPESGISAEAKRVAGKDVEQDVRIVALETRVANLERALRLMLEARVQKV